MNKKLISVLVASGILFNTSTLVMAAPLSSATNTTTTQASSISSSNLNDNKAKYQELDSKIKSLSSNIDNLNTEIQQLNETLKQNAIDIENVKAEISTAQSNINTLKEQIAKDQEVLGQRIRGLYMLDSSQNALTYLITSKNFGEFLSRMNAVVNIYSADKQLINELNAKQEQLNSNLTTLQNKENSLNQLNDSTKSSIEELNTKQSEYQNQINELNEQKQQVASTIASNEEELISNSISTINTSDSISQIHAVNSLKQLVTQLSTNSVITKANNAINEGENKIQSLSSQTSNSTSSSNNTATESNSTSVASSNSNSSSNNNAENSTTSSSSSVGSYIAEYSMVATAYTGGGLTAMGLKPVRNPDGISTIAVDPNVIPLGSKVYIPGYGYAIASDTGGAIKGNKIDLYMNSENACLNFGRQTVKLYLVAYPGKW